MVKLTCAFGFIIITFACGCVGVVVGWACVFRCWWLPLSNDNSEFWHASKAISTLLTDYELHDMALLELR